MKKTLLVLLTLAFTLIICSDVNFSLAYSGVTLPANGSTVDSDDDGLPDDQEVALGTDPYNPDTDDDGIIDGGDPDILMFLVDSLEDGVFKEGKHGLRMATTARLESIEAKFLNGHIEEGITGLENLRKRFDGCPLQPDPDDWIEDCTAQIQVQGLIDTLIANHYSYEIDPTIVPEVVEIPGLSGGPSRPVAVAIGPDGTSEAFVVNEVILQISDPGELAALLDTYGGILLRDGAPLLVEGETPHSELPANIGFYLLRIDPTTSSLNDFAPSMEAAGLRGRWVFSSVDAARVVALVARERANREISLNQIADFDTCAVCEHPDDSGDYLDAATWWWMTEDDNPATPAIDGISVGVIRAWKYLRYQGFPPLTPYYPTKVAVVDGGFDLDTTTGVPLFGGGDFLYSGSKPPQLDEIDYDWTAGGIANGFANCPGGCWHGQMSFGVCCGNARNLYGTAGTSGGGTTGAEIKTLLIRVGPDVWEIACGIYDAAYNNADVINASISFDCGSICRQFKNGNVLKAAVGSARNVGSIVVASAGNEGDNIDDNDRYPCELDGAICVGAILNDGKAWDGSNFGNVVDIWAPTGLYSTITRVSSGKDPNDTGLDELTYFNGTSCASPYLAGIVALMKALDRNLYKSQVLEKLQIAANMSTDIKVTPGYVDALRALEEVKSNKPPTVKIASPTDGEHTPYDGVFLHATVTDPEKAGPWGNEFEVSVTFSSDLQGNLCSDSGVVPPYGCSAPTLMIGTHTITATATDAFGATGTDQVTIVVENTAPTAIITYPPSGSTYYTSQIINFQGFGFDPDEIIEAGDLTWHSSINGNLGTGPAVSTLLNSGTHSITLTATDDLGLTGTDTIVINVLTGAGYPSAQITSPTDSTIVTLGNQVTFTGTGTDPEDGELSGSSLVWTSDVDGNIGTGKTITVTLSGSSCGAVSHVVTLTVTDSDGHTAAHSIRILVLELC